MHMFNSAVNGIEQSLNGVTHLFIKQAIIKAECKTLY